MNPILIGIAGALVSGHLQIAALLALIGALVPERLVPLFAVCVLCLLLK